MEDFRTVTIENQGGFVFPDSMVQELCKAFLQWREDQRGGESERKKEGKEV